MKVLCSRTRGRESRGRQTGCPRALDAKQIGFARRMCESAESIATITKILGISRQSCTASLPTERPAVDGRD